MKMHPFVIYADLKAVNTLVQDDLPHGSTIIESIHHICAWAYQIIVAPRYRHLFEEEPGFQGKPFSLMQSKVSEDCIQSFFESLSADVQAMRGIVLGLQGEAPMLEDVNNSTMGAKKQEAKNCCSVIAHFQ